MTGNGGSCQARSGRSGLRYRRRHFGSGTSGVASGGRGNPETSAQDAVVVIVGEGSRSGYRSRDDTGGIDVVVVITAAAAIVVVVSTVTDGGVVVIVVTGT